MAPASISVSDTAANIAADLALGASSQILGDLGLVSGIANSDAGAITLTAAQILFAGVDDGAGSAMSKVSGGTLVVTGATVAQIPTLAALGVAPTSMMVVDTAANIQADLGSGASSKIVDDLALISAITVEPAGIITLTSSQVQAQDINDGAGSAFSKISGATLVVSDVAVVDILTVLGLQVVPDHISVTDSAAAIEADLAGAAVIDGASDDITSVKPSDATLSVAAATSLYNAVTPITAIDLSDLTITGPAAALLTAHSDVPAMLLGAYTVLMTDSPTGLTAAEATILAAVLDNALGGQTMQVVDSSANLLDAANEDGINLATTVELSGPTTASAAVATQLAGLHAFNASGPAITVADTVANLLDAANAAGLAIAATVTPDGDVSVTSAQLAELGDIAGFAHGGHAITVADDTAAILALAEADLDLTATIHVTDSSANISADLASLQAQITDESHTLIITLSDGVPDTPSITVTGVSYSAYADTLTTITTQGAVRVIGTAAQLAAIATTLANDDVVGEVWVSDTATNILSALTALNSIGAKFTQATISDNTVNAAEVAALLAVPNLVSSGPLTVSDTGSQIAAAIDANGAAGLAFMNSHTIQLSENSVVTAAEAKTLQSLTDLQKNGFTLKVWDTASHLVNTIDGYLAAVNDPSIDAVHLKASGGSATVSPATAASLFSITNFSRNDPDGSPTTLTVQSTAANIEANFAALNAHRASLSNVVVSASTTVTDAVYDHLLTLGATMAGGQSLTVRDTAANIAANAPAQLAGSPSITPTTWALSASATLTQPNASILGGLSGFSAGSFTVTLAASVTGVSVADANTLGALGAAFRLNGNTVGVSGDVATLSGLSVAARSVVTPHITDTFANLATLVIADNLHGGTFTITDSATITVAQANAFLALLKVDGGAGIPVANVNFDGHVASVTDTLANIQTMTGAAGWTNNSSVHDDFNLVVADSVANLINGANTPALAAMNGTTFVSDQTTTAANAQSLYALQDTIHFSKGGHVLTIQDTPTNLLDFANVDALAAADVWQLSGNATVSAIDAETLLADQKFQVNHTLTVSDASDNLLDGVLDDAITDSAYVASIQVQLSGPETLDANTATRLVALPGFTNTGDLSIEDGSAYLLNSTNLAALNAATNVTLAGDETVSLLTATRLVALPNFAIGANTLTLASNDFADAATLRVIADLDSAFEAGVKTIKMTQDALDLTPTQYEALQDDNLSLNGHALSALATGVNVTSAAGDVHVTGQGVDGATLKVYASDGTELSSTDGVDAAFEAIADENTINNAMVVTQVVGGTAANSESAPIIAIERDVFTDFATAHTATFATSGEIQVDTNQYVDLYDSSEAPSNPSNPVLVYNSNAHTLALHLSGQAPLVIVTLGSATTPTQLDEDYIFIRHFI
ncbi:MAG: beta strand repeat-containing protein [Acetobacteraceae bacterium]